MSVEPLKRDYRRDFDLGDPELSARWNELIADLHQSCPVARSEVGGSIRLASGSIRSVRDGSPRFEKRAKIG